MSATSTPPRLSSTQRRALEILIEAGGSVIEWQIPETNEIDPVFGTVTPGHVVYGRLERMGLCFYTEEEPFDSPGDPLHGFQFSCEIYIEERGRVALAAN